MQNYLLAAKNTCSLTFSTCINLARIFSRILAKYYISRFFSTLFGGTDSLDVINWRSNFIFYNSFQKIRQKSDLYQNHFNNILPTFSKSNLSFSILQVTFCFGQTKYLFTNQLTTLVSILSRTQSIIFFPLSKKATDHADYGTDKAGPKGVGDERSMTRKATKVATSSSSTSSSISDRGSDITDAKTDNNDELAQVE